MKKKNIIEIESITINIGDTTVKVTPQQARTLFDALAQLLGEPKTIYRTYPWTYYSNGQWPLNGTITATANDLAEDTIINIQ